jgi:hypothetical protein
MCQQQLGLAVSGKAATFNTAEAKLPKTPVLLLRLLTVLGSAASQRGAPPRPALLLLLLLAPHVAAELLLKQIYQTVKAVRQSLNC